MSVFTAAPRLSVAGSRRTTGEPEPCRCPVCQRWNARGSPRIPASGSDRVVSRRGAVRADEGGAGSEVLGPERARELAESRGRRPELVNGQPPGLEVAAFERCGDPVDGRCLRVEGAESVEKRAQ